MLIFAQVFLLALFGCVATNIDNLLLVLSSTSKSQVIRSVTIFVIVLTVVIVLGFLASLGLDMAIPRSTAWVGLIPLSMGVYELTPLNRHNTESGSTVRGALALALPLAANSLDTLLIQTVLFTDIDTEYHFAALAGCATAVLLLAGLLHHVMTRSALAARLLPIAARLRPWLLMIVGVLILMDTGFDV